MRLSYHLFAASTALSVGTSSGNRFTFGIKNFAGTFTRTSSRTGTGTGTGASPSSYFLGITSTRGGDQETGSSDGNSDVSATSTTTPTAGDDDDDNGDVDDIMLNEISLTQEEEDAIKAQEEAFPDVVPTASDVGEHEPDHDHLTDDASIDDIDNYDEATTNILLQEVDDGDYVEDDFSAGTDDDFSAMVDDDVDDEAGNTRMDYSNTTLDDEGDFSEDQSLPSLSGASSGSGNGATIQGDTQEVEDEVLMEEEEPLALATNADGDETLMTNDEKNTLSTASTIDIDGNDNENANVNEEILNHYSSDHNSHSDLQEEGNNDENSHHDDDDSFIPDSALDMENDMENDEDLLMMMDDSDGDIFNVDIAVETDYPSFSDDSAACVDRMDLADAYDDEVLLTDNEAAVEVEVEVEADADADAEAEAEAEADAELAVDSAAELAVESAAELTVEAGVEASAESQIMLEETDIADVNMAALDIEADVDVMEEEVYEYSEEEIAEIEESIPNISELVSDDKIAPSVVQRGTTVNYVITENMRRLLVRKLGYKAAEVQNMKPDVAAVLVHKMLKRPKTGMPEQFYVDDAAPVAPKTKMWFAKRTQAGDFLRKALVPLVSVLLIAVSSFAVTPTSKNDNSNAVNAPPVSSPKAAVSAANIPKPLAVRKATLPTPKNDKKTSPIGIKPVEAILKTITKPKAKKVSPPVATKDDETKTANKRAESKPAPTEPKTPKKEGILKRVKQSVSKKESVAFAPSASIINSSTSESLENISPANIDQEDESLELLEAMLHDVEDLDKTIVDRAITFTLEKVDEVLKRPF